MEDFDFVQMVSVSGMLMLFCYGDTLVHGDEKMEEMKERIASGVLYLQDRETKKCIPVTCDQNFDNKCHALWIPIAWKYKPSAEYLASQPRPCNHAG